MPLPKKTPTIPPLFTEKMARVVVDQDTCIGCGMCVSLAPEVFAIDPESGKAMVIDENAPEAAAAQAIEMCPVNAISVEG